MLKKSQIQFCSNIGGEAIKRYAYEQRTRPRESLTMKELEEVQYGAAYSENGKYIVNPDNQDARFKHRLFHAILRSH